MSESTLGTSVASTSTDESTDNADTSTIDLDSILNGKNPISYLNELCQKTGLSYRIEEEGVWGPSHQPSFQFVVFVNEEQFPSAQGSNKQAARAQAVRLALEPLITRLKAQAEVQEEQNEIEADVVVSDATASVDDNEGLLELSEQTRQIINETGKSPISLLMEFAAKRQITMPVFETVQSEQPGCFGMRVVMGGKSFPFANAKNKKTSKTRAAALALNLLVEANEFSTTLPDLLPKRKITLGALGSNASFAQHVGHAVNTLFYEASNVARTAEVVESGKILAGIVMYDGSTDNLFVLSWATGNRCIKGGQLSSDGAVLNDCHAEILARRGLVFFLYDQVSQWLSQGSGPASTVFELNEQRRLCVRPEFSFHLYINTAPCGDGRVFCLSETAASTSQYNSTPTDTHSPLMLDRKRHGLLRTKIENGEGTIPVLDYSQIQTLDGITGGERLRTMSCSDKILKWNVLGLQGSLLSQFMDPVYLSSIVIGSLFHHGHLSRAVCCRASELVDLPLGYKVVHPILFQGGLQSNNARDTSKSGAAAVNWNFVQQQIEIIDGTKGMVARQRAPSRLSKSAFYKYFKQVCPAENRQQLMGGYYGESKARATAYNDAKIKFYLFCKEKGYGTWLGKPREEKLFE